MAQTTAHQNCHQGAGSEPNMAQVPTVRVANGFRIFPLWTILKSLVRRMGFQVSGVWALIELRHVRPGVIHASVPPAWRVGRSDARSGTTSTRKDGARVCARLVMWLGRRRELGGCRHEGSAIATASGKQR